MGLHIDSPEALTLAHRLADLTGSSLEVAVMDALRRQLERQVDIERRRQKIREISEHYASSPVLDDRTPDEFLGYDENGLPT